VGAFFMNIASKIKELERLKKKVPNQAKVISKKYKDVILDYIREKQLYEKGIDGNGSKLLKYKPFTIAIKKAKGEVYNRTTLLDSGSFYDGMDLIFTDQNAIGIFSRDEKAPDLISKYGSDIFAFTVNNQEEINEEIFLKNLIKWLLNTKVFTQI
jgi:hypothetical protein